MPWYVQILLRQAFRTPVAIVRVALNANRFEVLAKRSRRQPPLKLLLHHYHQ